MQGLPHLTQYARNRLQNRHTALYSHYREIEEVKSGSVLSGFEPATLRRVALRSAAPSSLVQIFM